MMRLEIVPVQYLYHVWAKVEPYLEKGLRRAGNEYNIDQLKVFLVQEKQTLCIFLDESNEIHGAIALEFSNYPNERIAFVTSIGGKVITEQYLWEEFETWLKTQGVTAIRGAAFESVARLWRQKFGFSTRYLIVEKKL